MPPDDHRINQLTPAQRRLLEQRLARAHQRSQAAPAAIPRRDWLQAPGSQRPLSFGQERLWTLYQLDPASPIYNRPLALRLNGPLAPSALQIALEQIVARHEVLRCGYGYRDGEPVCRLLPPARLALPVIDLSDQLPEERLAAARRILGADSRRPFDLAHGPVLRATLLYLEPGDYILLVTVHHIAFDAWSAARLTAELSAHLAGTAPLDLPIQYADYAAWQRQEPAAWQPLLAQAVERLHSAPPSLDLPGVRRPALQAEAGAWVTFTIPTGLVARGQALAQACGATRFMALLAAFQALLYRYSGQTDFVLGAPVAGRTHTELEPLIGFFVNMLPLRGEFSDQTTYRQALEQARAEAQAAFARQAIPFERLVEALGRPTDLSRPPVFQIVFNLKNLPELYAGASPVQMAPFDFDAGLSPYDLELEIAPAGTALAARFVYATALFDARRIEQMAVHFLALLEAALDAPDIPLAHLPVSIPGPGRSAPTPAQAPEPNRPAGGAAHSALERLLARLWADALGREPVDLDSNFFALGGHSLTAIRLTSQTADLLQIDLPVRIILDAPRLGDYAAAILAGYPDPLGLEALAQRLLQ